PIPGQPRRRKTQRLAVPGGCPLPVCLRRRPRALLFPAARISGGASEQLYSGRHPPRVRDAETVPALLHGRLRSPGLDNGRLEKPASAGRPALGDAPLLLSLLSCLLRLLQFLLSCRSERPVLLEHRLHLANDVLIVDEHADLAAHLEFQPPQALAAQERP